MTDNGIGMTKETIINYFAKVGRSYYQSSEFRSELQYHIENGYLSSPRSHFGIGILSSFMIADRVIVRTNPGSAHESWNVKLSGPGGIFWFEPTNPENRLPEQGTEITLELKPGYEVSETEDWLERLQAEFRYREYDPTITLSRTNVKNAIDPAIAIGRCVLWAEFPIRLRTDHGTFQEPYVIDHEFHLSTLRFIDHQELLNAALTWRCPRERLGEVSWKTFIWQDPATGSTIYLGYPSNTGGQLPVDDPTLISHIELGVWINSVHKYRKLVISIKGMRVDDVKAVEDIIGAQGLVGGYVGIDLRGDAAPALTASRQSVVSEGTRWAESVVNITSLLERFQDDLEKTISRLGEHEDNCRMNCKCLWHLDRIRPVNHENILELGLIQGCGAWELKGFTRVLWKWVCTYQLCVALSKQNARIQLANVTEKPGDVEEVLQFFDSSAFHDFELVIQRESLNPEITLDEGVLEDRPRKVRLGKRFASVEAIDQPLPLNWNSTKSRGVTIAKEMTLFSMSIAGYKLYRKTLFEVLSRTDGKIVTQDVDEIIKTFKTTENSQILAHCLCIMDNYMIDRGLFSIDRGTRSAGKLATPIRVTGDTRIQNQDSLDPFDIVFPFSIAKNEHLKINNLNWDSLFMVSCTPFLLRSNNSSWEKLFSLWGLEFDKSIISALYFPVDLWHEPIDVIMNDGQKKKKCISAYWNAESGDIRFTNGVIPLPRLVAVGKSWNDFKKRRDGAYKKKR